MTTRYYENIFSRIADRKEDSPSPNGHPKKLDFCGYCLQNKTEIRIPLAVALLDKQMWDNRNRPATKISKIRTSRRRKLSSLNQQANHKIWALTGPFRFLFGLESSWGVRPYLATLVTRVLFSLRIYYVHT